MFLVFDNTSSHLVPCTTVCLRLRQSRSKTYIWAFIGVASQFIMDECMKHERKNHFVFGGNSPIEKCTESFGGKRCIKFYLSTSWHNSILSGMWLHIVPTMHIICYLMIDDIGYHIKRNWHRTLNRWMNYDFRNYNNRDF